MSPVLAYWDLRGIAEPIRYLLHYVGVKFEDKRYTFGEGDQVFAGNWVPAKYSLGLDLPNLPYYIDGDVKITQSPVILRYLARKYGLYLPEGPGDETLKIEMIEAHVRDLLMQLVMLVLNTNYEEMKIMFKPRAVEKFDQASKFLGENDWLMGSKISHVDFLFFDILDIWKKFDPDIFQGMENIQKYMVRFGELSGVKEYRAKSIKWPIFGPITKWGGGGPPPDS